MHKIGRDSLSGFKIDRKDILNPGGPQNGVIGPRLGKFCCNGRFFLLVQLHWDGSAPAAGPAGWLLCTLVYVSTT